MFSSFSSFNSTFAAGKNSSAFSEAELVIDSLIVHYDSTNYTSGASITDESGESNTGTIVGSPTYSSPNFTFDGINDYIITTDLDDQITAAAESHSVEVWFNTTSDGNLIVYTGQTTPNTGYYHSAIEIYRDNPAFGLWNGTGITYNNSSDNVTDGNWHQLVLTYDGTSKRGYLDGSLVSAAQTVAWDSPMNDGTGAFHILLGVSASGTNMGSGAYFSGDIGILRVYNKALSDEEVAQNYSFNQNTF